MVEGTPSRPYGGYAADLCRVERNMRLRRRRLLAELDEDEICPTLVTFPGFGVGDFCDGVADLAPNGPVAHRVKIKCRGASHAIDATPARWRGDVGLTPLDSARMAEKRAADSPVDVHAGRAVGLGAGRRHPPPS
jgi:hypothetical protein